MSKAQDYVRKHQIAADAYAELRFQSKSASGEVRNDGRCELTARTMHAGDMGLVLEAPEAVTLGRWLIETFGETQ